MNTIIPSSALTMLAISFLSFGCSQEETMRQESSSMEPGVKPGEVVRINTGAYDSQGPERWDVIVFHSPLGEGMWCSRVVGLPGEVIDFREDGLVIDNEPVAIPKRLAPLVYQAPSPKEVLDSHPRPKFPYKIPAGSYFVMGDNVTNSLDSRYWGALPGSKVAGKVVGK